jgi:hypothetical protein
MWCDATNVDNWELECMINENGPKMSMATRYSCMINAIKECEQWTLNIKQQSNKRNQLTMKNTMWTLKWTIDQQLIQGELGLLNKTKCKLEMQIT